jgi:hypothetical protein
MLDTRPLDMSSTSTSTHCPCRFGKEVDASVPCLRVEMLGVERKRETAAAPSPGAFFNLVLNQYIRNLTTCPGMLRAIEHDGRNRAGLPTRTCIRERLRLYHDVTSWPSI